MDPKTGIYEQTVTIPIGMDCRASPLAIAIEKMGKVFVNAIPHMYDRPKPDKGNK